MMTRPSRPIRFKLTAVVGAAIASGCSGGSTGTLSAGSSYLPQSTHTSARATAAVVSPATSVTSYSEAIVSSKPVAYYPLNDTNAILADQSGNKLNGSYGTSVEHTATAIHGSGSIASFPGGAFSTNRFAQVAATSSLAPTSALTVEGWIRASALNRSSGYESLISYGREIQGQSYAVQLSPGNQLHVFLTTASGGNSIDSRAFIASGKSYFVTVTLNGQSVDLYVNGKLDTSAPLASPLRYTSADGLGIGGAQGGRWDTFQGAISDVAVYDYALSSSTIASQYADGTSGTPTVEPSPSPIPVQTAQPTSGQYSAAVTADKAIALYKMNATASTLVDSLGGNNGTYGSAVAHNGTPLTSDAGVGTVFNGSNTSTGIVTSASGLHPSSSLSVEAWISFPKATSTLEPIVASGTDALANQAYGFYIESGVAYFQVHPQNGGMTLRSSVLTPGTPYHLVGTFDGSNVRFYVNGELAASSTTHGSFVYHTNGFAIGSSVNGSSATFTGTIGGVALYNYALSSAQVETHFETGAYAPMASELPHTAQSFTDSLGVNTHFGDADYGGSQFKNVANLLEASGIKHIREGTVVEPNFEQQLNQLAASGIKSTIVASLNETDQLIKQFPSTISNSIEAYEGPNEPNYAGSGWTSDTINTMSRLHNDVKTTSSLAHLPILAPALSAGWATLGSVAQYCDYGNMHDYFATYNPGTGGWGSTTSYGVYGSLQYNKSLVAVEAPDRPIIATETGYGSAVNSGPNNTIDYSTAAKYIPRTYFIHYNAGIARTFIYEFLDESGTDVTFTNNGLVDVTLKPKPAYNAVKSILSDLSDSGTPFSPKALTYRLTGNMANVQHTLLEKSDGTYYLALWLEVSSYSGGVIKVPSQSVTISTQNAMAASVMRLASDGTSSTTTLAASPATIFTLPVTDQISIVRLSP